MCTDVLPCQNPLLCLNDALHDFATPPHTAQRDCETQERILRPANHLLRYHVCGVFHLPPLDPEHPEALASHTVQQAAEAMAAARQVLLERAHRRRAAGHPLVVTASEFLRFLVVNVAYAHGPDCYGRLNNVVVSLLPLRQLHQDQLDVLFETVRRCCCDRLGLTLTGHNQPTPQQRHVIAAAAAELVARFLRREIWQNGVTAAAAADSADAAAVPHVQPLYGVSSPVRHVDRERFAAVADPLLIATVVPTPAAPPSHLPPAPPGSAAETLRRIEEHCDRVAEVSGVVALRHLCYLLFRPPFPSATAFCAAFSRAGLHYTSTQASNALTWWLEQLAPGVSVNRGIRDGLDARMARLSSYGVLACTPAACSRLVPELPHSACVLADFWRLAIGRPRRHGPPTWGRFVVRENGTPPDGVEIPVGAGTFTSLILDYNEEQ